MVLAISIKHAPRFQRIATTLAATAVAMAFVSLANGRTPAAAADGTITTDNVKSAETDIGDLVADSIRAELGAEIGIAPALAFKVNASSPRPATVQQVVQLVDPPSDRLSLLTLRGDKIITALEHSVLYEPQSYSGFLQVSGLRFTYDLSKESGKRVVSVTVNGRPLDASRNYKVATTHPLAAGQDGYFLIFEKSDVSIESQKTIETAIRDYVKGHGGSASPAVDGRIAEFEKTK